MNFQNVKRIVLIILTIIAVLQTGISLLNSWQQPQTQSSIELYQTNLILNATEWEKFTTSDLQKDTDIYPQLREQIIGKEPLKNAEEQYVKLRDSLDKSKNIIADRKSDRPSSILSQKQQIDSSIDKLDLRIGILQAERGDPNAARQTWSNAIERSKFRGDKLGSFKTAYALIDLWGDNPSIEPGTEALLNSNLDSWFKYKALTKLYQVQGRSADLANLKFEQQQVAEAVVNKLLLVGVLPVIGLLVGILSIVGLTIQLVFKKNKSILATNAGMVWKTPWDLETIGIVLIVGFFTVKDLVLPVLLGLTINLLRIEPQKLDNIQQVTISFVAYIGVAIIAILILWLALKKYLPLPPDWFKFKVTLPAIGWGVGGYLCAIPLVILVSLINQQIWGDKGGGNPILPIALQGKDELAKALLFLTACVAAPVFEEIIFRGFLLPSLTKYVPVWGAIGISSLVFAIAHLSLSEVIPLTLLGMLLGFVYTRSRNLVSSILMHSLWNSGTLITLFILGSGNS